MYFLLLLGGSEALVFENPCLQKGALIITYPILRVPYYNYSIMGSKNPILIIQARILDSFGFKGDFLVKGRTPRASGLVGFNATGCFAPSALGPRLAALSPKPQWTESTYQAPFCVNKHRPSQG